LKIFNSVNHQQKKHIMNSTGKAMRRSKGLNRHEIHRANHAHKSPAKIRRANWTRTKF